MTFYNAVGYFILNKSNAKGASADQCLLSCVDVVQFARLFPTAVRRTNRLHEEFREKNNEDAQRRLSEALRPDFVPVDQESVVPKTASGGRICGFMRERPRAGGKHLTAKAIQSKLFVAQRRIG